MEVKIGSYNICHCGDYTNRKDTDPVWVQNINVKAMADAIKRLNFDVIGLNEVYFTGVNEDSFDQAKKLADLAGYAYYANAEGASDGRVTIGNALLSKYPIVRVEKIKIPTIPESERVEEGWYEERVLLVADLDVNGKIYKVIASHFGCIKKERELIVKKICEIIEREDVLVVMGDFNALPHAEELAPLYDKMVCTADQTANCEFTFASYNPHILIDYIFVKKGVEIKNYSVHKEKASDHFPISAILKI